MQKRKKVDQKSLLGWFCERVQIGGGNHKSLMSHKVVTKIPVSSLHFWSICLLLFESVVLSLFCTVFLHNLKFGYIDQITEKAICARLTPTTYRKCTITLIRNAFFVCLERTKYCSTWIMRAKSLIGFYGSWVTLFF